MARLGLLMGLLAVMLTGCSLNARQSELSQSLTTWQRLKVENSGYYRYETDFISWTGFRSTTTLRVQNEKVIARAYTSSYENDAGEPIEESWLEEGATVGSHDSGADAVTIDALYTTCRTEVLTKNTLDNELYLLRTTPNIPDDAATSLFKNVLKLSKQGDPIRLVYTDKSARDFGALPSQCGWHGGDDYGITYETDVSGRDDLEPDPAAVSYPLEYLLSDTFRQFYEPLRQPDPSDTRSFEQIAQAIFEHHGNGVLVALEESGQPVAMGIVSTLRLEPDQNAGGINMLGVALNKRRRGWGKRLHRHLMWEVKQRTARYVGATDASNTAMRRLFELNGCTEAGKSWELEPVT